MLLVVYANENQVNEKDLLDTFEVLDFNDDGLLSYREIRGATKQLGQKMSTKELRAFFSVADKNGDRKISKEEELKNMLIIMVVNFTKESLGLLNVT